MLTRSVVRLWTPKYFRGQSKAACHPGPRRARVVSEAGQPSAAAKTLATPHPGPQQKSKPTFSAPKSPSLSSSPAAAASALPAPQRTAVPSAPPRPIVQKAQELLVQLSHPDIAASPATAAGAAAASLTNVSAEATRNFVAFTARRDVLGPLRHLLPAAPGAAYPSLASVETADTPQVAATHRKSNISTTPRLRVVAATSSIDPFAAAPPPVDGAMAAAPFTLDELAVFLQLYESVNAEDGQVLRQLMAEVHRQLFAYAAQFSRAHTSRRGHTHATKPEKAINTSEEQALEYPLALPLPKLLFIMSSLGLVEESVLTLVTSAATIGETSMRRGLLYHQLPRYPTEELTMLVVALHRFGHAQQPSMKAVTKALRASLYNKNSAAGAFHRIMRDVKKRLYRAAQLNAHDAEGDAPAAVSADVEDEERQRKPDSVAVMLQKNAQLQALVVQLQCPLFLLLEALTAMSLTVYRRTDVVSFLSDLIAVTAVEELALARAPTGNGKGDDADEYVLFVAHHLLRAAKLTEEMELPQPLLSEVFSWSCTLSGKSVLVDGGEDSDVPSDRVAYYDHVTADLVKVNRTD